MHEHVLERHLLCCVSTGCLGYRVLGLQGAWVTGCLGYREPGLQGAWVTGSLGYRVPGLQGAWVTGSLRSLQSV